MLKVSHGTLTFAMNVRIENDTKAARFAAVFRNLRQFADAVTLRFSSHGLHVQTLDQAQACLLDLKLPGTWFCSFDHGADEETVVSVSTSTVQKVMATRDSSQCIDIRYDPNASDYITVTFEPTGGSYRKEFEVQCLDLVSELMTPDSEEADIDMRISPTRLTSMIRQLQGFSASVYAELTDESTMFTASGDHGRMCIRGVGLGGEGDGAGEESDSEYCVTEGTSVSQKFGLKHLDLIQSFGGFAPDVALHFSDNRPLHVRYGDADNGHMAFYLAPMVDE